MKRIERLKTFLEIPDFFSDGIVDAPAVADFMLFILVSWLIIFSPVPHTTALREIAFFPSLFIFAFLLWRRKAHLPLRSPLFVPLMLFCLWVFICLPFALNVKNSLHDAYAHLVRYIILLILVAHCFASKKRFLFLTWLIMASSALLSLGLMIHYYLVLGNMFQERLGAMCYSELPINIIAVVTVFAALLSACQMGFARMHRQKVFAGLFFAVLLAATLATRSKGAFIALATGLLCIYSSDKKRLAVFALLFVLTIGVLQTTNYFSAMIQRFETEPRIKIWYNFMEITKDHPVAGIGFGMQTYDDAALIKSYNDKLPAAYRDEEPRRAPHNLLLDVAVRTGFVGLAVWAIVLFAFCFMAGKIIWGEGADPFCLYWARGVLAAFVALFIQGMLENILSGPPAVILFILFAMVTILWNAQKNGLYGMDVPDSGARRDARGPV